MLCRVVVDLLLGCWVVGRRRRRRHRRRRFCRCCGVVGLLAECEFYVRVVGLLGCWVVGLLGCWVVGLLGCWVVGLLGCWVVGLLGCWVVGRRRRRRRRHRRRRFCRCCCGVVGLLAECEFYVTSHEFLFLLTRCYHGVH